MVTDITITPSTPTTSTVIGVTSKILTNNEIKALPTTPIEIIATPGAGKMIVPLFALLNFSWVADYSNFNANSFIRLMFSTLNQTLLTGLAESPSNELSSFLAYGSSCFTFFNSAPFMNNGEVGSIICSLTDAVNNGLVLYASNGGDGDFTGGNVANTLKVTCYFMVIDS